MNALSKRRLAMAAFALGLILAQPIRAAHPVPPGMESASPAEIGRALERDASNSNRERLATGAKRYELRQARRSAYIDNLHQNAQLAVQESGGLALNKPKDPAGFQSARLRFVLYAISVGLLVLLLVQSRRNRNSSLD